MEQHLICPHFEFVCFRTRICQLPRKIARNVHEYWERRRRREGPLLFLDRKLHWDLLLSEEQVSHFVNARLRSIGVFSLPLKQETANDGNIPSTPLKGAKASEAVDPEVVALAQRVNEGKVSPSSLPVAMRLKLRRSGMLGASKPQPKEPFDTAAKAEVESRAKTDDTQRFVPLLEPHSLEAPPKRQKVASPTANMKSSAEVNEAAAGGGETTRRSTRRAAVAASAAIAAMAAGDHDRSAWEQAAISANSRRMPSSTAASHTKQGVPPVQHSLSELTDTNRVLLSRLSRLKVLRQVSH